MSQQLIPVSGGTQQLETTTSQNRLLSVSPQYVQAKGLETRPTEWFPGGRPIYRRLPGTSQTYQTYFYDLAPSSNTAVSSSYEEIGYVFIPWGTPQNDSNTLLVSSSDSKKDLLIKSGIIVWKYGNTEVLPAMVNLPILEVVTGKYELSYQLVYDDSPVQTLYQVEDFSLRGQPMAISSSTDDIVGWRYASLNAFLNTSTLFWSNSDSYFPSYSQPSESYIQWESELPSAYSKIELRCPPGTAYTGTATLWYFNGTAYSEVDTVSIQSESGTQFFEFTADPKFQTGWKVEFSSLDMSLQSITVNGVLTLLQKQAAPSSRATLVMYPEGLAPSTITTSSGEEVPATYCPLAVVEIGKDFTIEKIKDARYIVHRDFQPVSDWITKPFDDDLIDLYEQVSNYSPLWMDPSLCLKQEYASLDQYQVIVEV